MTKNYSAYLMSTQNEHRNPIGLCLSAGGALGFAHIGVLEALLEKGIEPDIISGCSMGAIVGAFYAAGMSPSEMMSVIEAGKLYKVSKLMVLNPSFWKTGFSNHAAVKEVMHEIIPHNSFEKLQRRLFIGVTNLNTMECEIISSGNRLAEWVSASASIPGVFETFEDNGHYYVDGAVVNHLPAQPLVTLCRAIIGVNVKPFIAPVHMKKPIEVIRATLRGLQYLNSADGRLCCAHLIETFGIKRFHEFSFNAYHELYRQGYKDTIEYIRIHPEILSL